MSFALAAIGMLFIGLTSAFMVRRGLDPHWRAIGIPPLALVNAAVLIASSITLELGRRSLRLADWRRQPLARNRWFAATWCLGGAFVAGQLAVWNQLASAGLYMSTNPHASFFYLLTALHGAHLVGGIGVLSWTMWISPLPLPPRGGPGFLRGPSAVFDRERWLGVLAIYWHAMDALWVYLLVLLFAWK
jgi:cytochrome c oxidase subunit 3